MSGGFSVPAVQAALAELARYGGSDGPDPEKAMRYALLAGVAEQERHEARERAARGAGACWLCGGSGRVEVERDTAGNPVTQVCMACVKTTA